ncbi:MAG TPA: hypothetical protein VG755_03205 [Nannocystaceae bacterium]|nr:hypothetical protein [Nannocystaceae bacterium]
MLRRREIGALAIAQVLVVGCEHEHEHAAELPIDCEASIVPVGRFDDVQQIHGIRGTSTNVLVVSHPSDPSDLQNPTAVDMLAFEACGDELRTVAEGVWRWERPPEESLPWELYFRADAATPGERLAVLMGADPEPRAFERLDRMAWSARGMLGFRGIERGAPWSLIEVVTTDDGQVTERVLYDDFEVFDWPDDSMLQHHMIGTNMAGETVLVDIARGGAEIIAPAGVEVKSLDDDGRILLMTPIVARSERPWLHDRSSGVDVRLGRSTWTDFERRMLDGVVVTVAGEATIAPAETHVVLVPELRELWWPAAGTYDKAVSIRDGTRLLLGEGVLLLLEPAADWPISITLPDVDALARGRVEVHAVRDELWVTTRDDQSDDVLVPRRWYRVLPGGALAELFDRPVTTALRLTNERWAYIVTDDANDEAGELRLLDMRIGEDRFVEREVAPALRMLNRWIGPTRRDDVGADFFFRTVEPGDRSTLWWARLE